MKELTIDTLLIHFRHNRLILKKNGKNQFFGLLQNESPLNFDEVISAQNALIFPLSKYFLVSGILNVFNFYVFINSFHIRWEKMSLLWKNI